MRDDDRAGRSPQRRPFHVHLSVLRGLRGECPRDPTVKIKTDEITSVIKQEIEQFSAELEISEVGRVVEVGDGIARI